MTALDRYAKLEAVGRYHDARSSAPREVVVSFGERSLVIMGLNDEPIAHWPLASLRATGTAARLPVEIAPNGVGDERLLLDDAEMSAAIAEVCPDLHRIPPPAPRRLPWRGFAAAIALAAMGAGALALWPMLPDSLAELVPPMREAALGEALAARMPGLLEPGAPPAFCVGEEGVAALGTLAGRLVSGPDRPIGLSVLDHPERDALALPGGRVLLFRGLLDAAGTPEEIAGIVAHAIGHARTRDPLRTTLEGLGTTALAGMLIGDITGESVIRDAAVAVLGAAYPPEVETRADAAAFAVLSEAGLPTVAHAELAGRLAAGPTARYLDRHPWTPARSNAAAAADTIGDASFKPALRDRDWIALGTICDRTRPSYGAGF